MDISNNKIFMIFSLLLIFVFFFVAEWRWQAVLIGMYDIKALVLASVVSVMLIFMAIFYIKRGTLFFWIISLLICYWIVLSAINMHELEGVFGYNFARECGVWVINAALFIVASNEKVWKCIYAHSKLAVVLFALYVLPVMFILFLSGHAAEANFNIRNLKYIMWNWDFEDLDVSYQSFGDKIAVLTFIVVSFRIDNLAKLAIATTTLVALYIVGSKASMVGYIFACGAYYAISLYCHKHYMKCAFLLSCFFCLLLCGLTYIANNPAMQYSDNWLISTVASGRKDISVSSRQAIEIENQKTRSSRLLLGDYKFDYKLGRHGGYTHSAIGIIDYYGMPIFLITVGIWLYLLVKLICLVKQRNPLVSPALMAMLFYTLLFTIARFPPLNYLLYWTLGMAVCAITYASATRNNVTHRHIQRQLT